MTPAGDGRGGGGGYLRFLALAAGVAAATAALGVLPTRSLGGPEAIPGLLAACAVSFLASALGGVPLARARRADWARAALAATALRLLVAVALGGAVAASGVVPRVPLLLWLALSYMAQLAVDTWYAIRD